MDEKIKKEMNEEVVDESTCIIMPKRLQMIGEQQRLLMHKHVSIGTKPMGSPTDIARMRNGWNKA